MGKGEDMSENSTNQAIFPIQVRAIGDAARRDSLLSILRTERLLDQEVLDEHPPFFWGGIISSGRVDAYYTRMLLSSLRNYARDASQGVAFLPGHDHKHLPIGSSLTGELIENGNEAEVRADFYTLTNLQIGNIRTNDFAAGIKAGITRDLSIGMYGGEYICDICEQNYLRATSGTGCPHLAGFTYEEEKGGVVRQILCTVGIDDARLAEVSGVYDGATPGAMIEKVYELARSGALDSEDVRHAESVYRLDKEVAQRMLALPSLQKRHAGVDIPGQKPREEERMNAEQFKELTSTLVRAGVLKEEQRESASEAEVLSAADKLAKRVAELEPRAADGDAYRSDLVSEALAEGVRAYGDKFAKETYEQTLRNAPLAVIKQMRDDWKAVGDARFAGGRQTTEGEEAPNEQHPEGSRNGKQVELRAPASQYK